jgi:hypothetical protein
VRVRRSCWPRSLGDRAGGPDGGRRLPSTTPGSATRPRCACRLRRPVSARTVSPRRPDGPVSFAPGSQVRRSPALAELTEHSGGAKQARRSRCLELLGVSLVGDVRPILENSTACTIVNAKLSSACLRVGLRFLWIELNVSRHSSVRLNSFVWFPIPGAAWTRDVPPVLPVCVHTFTESLILAQDERWRRA